ncbi:MAG: hypothetical protein HQL82_10695 [Magnetococcales bacterium]|nr:hypothetical protein [Magnetococcales bacterium]
MNSLRKIRDRLLIRLLDRRLPPPSPREAALIEALRRRIAAHPATPPRTGDSAAQREWDANVERLRHLVATEDPREFLRWDVITRTMVVGNTAYVQQELAHLRDLPDWGSRWAGVLKESAVGHPRPFPALPGASGNLIHHAYHLARFEAWTGRPVAELGTIFEFGGGYGSLCRLCHRLGFRGRYGILDLPVFADLQEFFLRADGLPVGESVHCSPERESLERRLAPAGAGGRLFLATWSLSETARAVREPLLPFLTTFDHFLIAYQERFNEVDNVAWFGAWQASRPDLHWQERTIAHLPGNRYLMGSPRAALPRPW